MEQPRGSHMEQPRGSQLLHEDMAMELITKLGATDQLCCMCSHGLKDPDNGKPCMKQTCFRGNITLRRAIRWCECKVEHQLLQGTLMNGTVTLNFCAQD